MNDYLKHKKTNTVIRKSDGKTMLFGFDDFVARIVKGNDCFICGAEAGSKPFNNEHVIPNWILKNYGTPESFMVLPNHTTIKNTSYTVPCCQDCNSELGKKIEVPVSKLLKKSFEEIITAVDKDDRLYKLLFKWLCLLFFKTHLKDSYLPLERDKRKDAGMIADQFCWHGLFHIHNIVRQIHTDAKITKDVYGTILLFKALKETPQEEFDYLDNLTSQVMMVKLGGIVIISVLNDSRYCLAGTRTFLSRISGSLNSVQIRELFARMRYLNSNIKERPTYYSLFNARGFLVGAKKPKKIEFLLGDLERVSLYPLMRFYIEELMPPNLPDRDQLVRDLEEGKAQYILDENEVFFQHKGYQEKNP